MNRREANLGCSLKGEAQWRAAAELLEARQYKQAADLLRQAQVTSEGTGDEVLADILTAACRICLACDQCRADAAWHRRAREEADQRERELRRQLGAILDVVSRGETSGTHETREVPSRVAAPDLVLHERGAPEPVRRPGLWQRIQAVLRRQRHPLQLASRVPAPPRVGGAGGPSAPPDVIEGMPGAPSLVVYCLGPFRVYQDEQPVDDWPSSKGKCIFKYLVTHRERPVAKEVLMELFWPGAPPDAARNNLNVAIYGLRQALRQARPRFSHVLFQNDCYLFNPDMQVWVDCEAFADYLTTARGLEQRGELVAAMRQYGAAEALYRGQFLQEDRYEDWPIPLRQSLQDDYLSLLEQLSRYYYDKEDYAACATLCGKMLAVDACREQAHRRLMRCYSRQGHRHMALRQYHLCVEALREDLDVLPTQMTTALYERIRKST